MLAGLVAGGIYLPRHSKTEARQGDAQQTPSPAAPANAAISNTMQPETAPAATLPNPPASDSTQPAPPPTTRAEGISNAAQSVPVPVPSPALHFKKLNPQGTASGQQPPTPPQGANQGASPDQPTPSIDRDEVEHQIDQLSNRAAAVNSSLDRLQQQQNSAGYGLRGDIVAKQGSMKTNLSRAESAEERGDLPQAKKYADMAASDVEVLEHFLGH